MIAMVELVRKEQKFVSVLDNESDRVESEYEEGDDEAEEVK